MESPKLMEIQKIYLGLEQWRDHYAEEEEKYKALYERAKKNREQIELTMMQLEEGDFKMPEMEEKKEIKMDTNVETHNKVEIVEKKEDKKQLTWKHQTAVLIKYGKDGTKLGTYQSQRKLAEQLGVSQTTVTYWLKQPKEEQIKKRNFYIQYEY